MRGKVAKMFRKLVYGDTVSNPKGRKYQKKSTTIHADPIRKLYQKTKMDYMRVPDTKEKVKT